MWQTLLTIGLGQESHTLSTLDVSHAKWLARRWMRLTHRKGGYLIVTQWVDEKGIPKCLKDS